MDLGIKGKVALVSASSKGIGRAIAEELAANGASLVMCARGEKELRATAKEIRGATGVEVLDVVADVSQPDDITRLTRAALDKFGRVDMLVTNSGGPPAGAFESLTPAMWHAAAQLLLFGTVELIRGVLPGMKERKWGRILNVTSIAAKQPVDGLMLSNSLRAAVHGFARTLANEVAPFGITVNNILPGYTRTDRVVSLARHASETKGISVEESYRSWEEQVPMGRLAEPKEIATVAAFLLSERASYVTAGSIAVDGGWIRSLV
ncbi:MAG: SDR family oxidoreductase [Gemmatimonadota bacterium]|nr:SDR family oxidoreductase [Gemmatimonadota bacterium]